MARSDADMTQGVIWKQLVSFAIPMAVGLLFQQLYNTVDTLVVGTYVGKEALAAVGSTGSIINMLVGLCAGLSTGASVVISQSYGAHDEARLQTAVHTTISVTFILCAVATTAGLLLIDPMLRMMQTPADVWDSSKSYLTIYFSGISGLLMYNMGSGILRAVGDSPPPAVLPDLFRADQYAAGSVLCAGVPYGREGRGAGDGHRAVPFRRAGAAVPDHGARRVRDPLEEAVHSSGSAGTDFLHRAALRRAAGRHRVFQRVCAILHQRLWLCLHGRDTPATTSWTRSS